MILNYINYFKFYKISFGSFDHFKLSENEYHSKFFLTLLNEYGKINGKREKGKKDLFFLAKSSLYYKEERRLRPSELLLFIKQRKKDPNFDPEEFYNSSMKNRKRKISRNEFENEIYSKYLNQAKNLIRDVIQSKQNEIYQLQNQNKNLKIQNWDFNNTNNLLHHQLYAFQSQYSTNGVYFQNSIYTGSLLGNQPHGFGRIVYPGNISYEGGFNYGIKQGFGYLTNEKGQIY